MVKNKMLRTDISLALVLFVFLYISYTFDKIYRTIVADSPYEWLYPVASLFVGTVALLLFWFMQNKPHHKWVEFLYLSVGLFVAFAYNMSNLKIFKPLLCQYTFGGSIPIIFWWTGTFWRTTYLHIAGCLIGATGLSLLLLPKNKPPEEINSF